MNRALTLPRSFKSLTFLLVCHAIDPDVHASVPPGLPSCLKWLPYTRERRRANVALHSFEAQRERRDGVAPPERTVDDSVEFVRVHRRAAIDFLQALGPDRQPTVGVPTVCPPVATAAASWLCARNRKGLTARRRWEIAVTSLNASGELALVDVADYSDAFYNRTRRHSHSEALAQSTA